jgi:hypothetical protein
MLLLLSVVSVSLEWRIGLSAEKIVQGAPVDIILEIVRPKSDSLSVWVFHDFLDELVFTVSLKGDGDAKLVSRRQLAVYPWAQQVLLHKQASDRTQITTTYPLHAQYSTHLPQGVYTVALDNVMGLVKRPEDRAASELPPVAVTASLEILPYDEVVLRSRYEELLKEALAFADEYSEAWHMNDSDWMLPQSVKTLLWACGPEAVPYQIRLLWSEITGFRLWPSARVHSYDNIVKNASIEDVRKLTAIASTSSFNEDNTRSRMFDPLLIWALQRLHVSGNEEIQFLTRQIIERYPTPIDIQPLSRQYGSLRVTRGGSRMSSRNGEG